jgi:hypothetical protein
MVRWDAPLASLHWVAAWRSLGDLGISPHWPARWRRNVAVPLDQSVSHLKNMVSHFGRVTTVGWRLGGGAHQRDAVRVRHDRTAQRGVAAAWEP